MQERTVSKGHTKTCQWDRTERKKEEKEGASRYSYLTHTYTHVILHQCHTSVHTWTDRGWTWILIFSSRQINSSQQNPFFSWLVLSIYLKGVIGFFSISGCMHLCMFAKTAAAAAAASCPGDFTFRKSHILWVPKYYHVHRYSVMESYLATRDMDCLDQTMH